MATNKATALEPAEKIDYSFPKCKLFKKNYDTVIFKTGGCILNLPCLSSPEINIPLSLFLFNNKKDEKMLKEVKSRKAGKKIFTSLTLLLLAFSGLAQISDSKSYDELIKQSRRARTTSIIMVSTGPVIAAGGIGTLIYGLLQNEIDDGNAVYDQNGNFIGYSTKKHTAEIVVGAAGTLIGLGIALSSIAFTNKADNLKREARKMKLKTSTDRINIPGFQNNFANSRTRQFKLSLTIPLGK